MRKRGTVLVVLAALLGAGCGSSGNDGGGSGEGELVFYCGIPETSCDALGDAFSEVHPDITVLTSRAPSTEITTRYMSEREAQAPTADVLMISDYEFIAAALEQGALKPWDDLLPADYPEEYIAETGSHPISVALNAMIYNTDLVDEAEVPSTYADVLDNPDQWRGRVCSASPAAAASIGVMWGTLSDVNGGDEFFEQARALEIRWYEDGNAPATAATAAGECALQMLGNVGRVAGLQAEGAPLDLLYPPGVTGATFTPALNSEPANAEAQALFAEWIISPEASQLLVDLDPSTAVAYVQGDAPSFTPPNFDYYQQENLNRVMEQLGIQP